jgi:hypothetical protein
MYKPLSFLYSKKIISSLSMFGGELPATLEDSIATDNVA